MQTLLNCILIFSCYQYERTICYWCLYTKCYLCYKNLTYCSWLNLTALLIMCSKNHPHIISPCASFVSYLYHPQNLFYLKHIVCYNLIVYVNVYKFYNIVVYIIELCTMMEVKESVCITINFVNRRLKLKTHICKLL